MDNLRVSELAKELNITSKELIEKFAEISINVKSHSNTVTPEQIRRIKEHLGVMPKKSGAKKAFIVKKAKPAEEPEVVKTTPKEPAKIEKVQRVETVSSKVEIVEKPVLKERKKDYIILFISFLLLGGGSYLAPLAATLTVVLIMVVQLEVKELDLKNKRLQFKYDWRNLWILLAFLVELIGLAISFMAPGNSVRGGEEFGADLKWALQCIYYAIDRGIYLGEDFFLKNAVTTVVYIILAIIIWEQLWRSGKEKMKFRFPLLFVIYMNGVYWATYTPEIYSRSDVSGGVRNTYFHIFLIVTFVNMIYVHGWVQEILTKYWKKKAVLKGCSFESIRDKSVFCGKNYKVVIEIPAVVLSCILLIYVASISEVITTNEYCVECISNGSLERYLEVRREQHEILSTSEEKNVTVPEMEAPYPLLHMLMSDSEMGGQNINRAKYYNKDSIKAELIRDN